jgi:arogenate dehydrogenase (NADP+)
MRIGIIGLGLIGGSLGLDLRRLGHEVWGVSRQTQTCDLALERGVADRVSLDLASLAEAEIVMLCTPLDALESTVRDLVPYLSPETLLTDVGSVKGAVVETIEPLWANFLGGHPMAGTSDQGIGAALPSLFAGAPYVLTPTPRTPVGAVERLHCLVESLGAQPIVCSPADHDRAVAWISHLPVMISSTLIGSCADEPTDRVRDLAQSLASSGFRDTSRVGGGNPELGTLMARYNRQALLDCARAYRDRLDGLISLIDSENWAAITAQLESTREARPQYLK